jgi:hypothetical protein
VPRRNLRNTITRFWGVAAPLYEAQFLRCTNFTGAANRLSPSHNPSPTEMRALFDGAGFRVSDQHRVRRPVWTRLLSDLITVGVKD